MSKLGIGIQGEVTIIQGGNILLKEKNMITHTAALVILNAMSSVTTNRMIDKISFIVNGVMKYKNISNIQLDYAEDSITYITTLIATDFSGTITQMQLLMSSVNNNLALKEGINIVKTNDLDIEIRWKIKLKVTTAEIK